MLLTQMKDATLVWRMNTMGLSPLCKCPIQRGNQKNWPEINSLFPGYIDIEVVSSYELIKHS